MSVFQSVASASPANEVLDALDALKAGQFDLICLSHLRWDFVYQRPQHLMERCARGHRVFFVEEPVLDNGPAFLDVQPRQGGVLLAVPHLPPGLDPPATEQAQRGLLDGLLREYGVQSYVLWYYTPMALGFTDHLAPLGIVYDCMDELALFAGAPPQLQQRERDLFARADLVFTGGQSLYEAKRRQHPRVWAFPSSVDVAHFRQAREWAAEPADQAPIPHPRLGFYGVIDERLDLGLLAGVADARPDWHLVIIGPVVKIDPAHLPRRANLHYLGGKSYRDLPAYLAGWDLAMLPFARNDATRFISPTKTPEYLAAGCPVVSTSIRDVVRPYGQLGLARIADTPPDFVAAVEAALREPRAARLERVDAFLAQVSWDHTWAQMHILIQSACGARVVAEAPPAPAPPRPITVTTPAPVPPRPARGRAAPPPTLFKSFWLGGFESSYHINRAGVRLDMLAATQHDRQAAEDYARLRQMGILTARDAVRWPLVDKGGRYDFASLAPMVEAAQQQGVQIVWDLCHFGWPDDVDLFAPSFVTRFARYCGAVARFMADTSDEVPYYTPINEISFLAWAAGGVGYLYPFAQNRAPEVKRQLVRAAIAGSEAVWEVDPRARFLYVEPAIHVVPPRDRPDLADEVARLRATQFEAWDMLAGVTEPGIGGHPRYLDVVGVNFYYDNQWEHPSGRRLGWDAHPLDDRWQPLSDKLAEVYARYRRPLVIGETSHFGAGRAAWIREIGAEVQQARQHGIPVEGVCIYPILDRPDWDDAARWHHSGLWDLQPDAEGSLRRVLVEDYAAALRRLQEGGLR